MIDLLLTALFGPKCQLCATRYRDLLTHEVTAHTDMEWRQHDEMRRRRR